MAKGRAKPGRMVPPDEGRAFNHPADLLHYLADATAAVAAIAVSGTSGALCMLPMNVSTLRIQLIG